MASATEVPHVVICAKFSELVAAMAGVRDEGHSKEQHIETIRGWERADAVDHPPTESERLVSKLMRQAVELVHRHAKMSADALKAAVEQGCTVNSDLNVHVKGL